MKLAFVTHTVYPDFIGGREHHVHHLARAFSKDYDVVVLGGGKTKIPRDERQDGYRLVRLPTISITVSKNPLQIYRIIPQLRTYLEKENPDIVHAFEYGAHSTRVAWAYSKNNRRSFFLTVYGYVFRNPLLKIGKRVYDRFFGRPLLEGADGIFCVSQTQYNEVAAITQKPVLRQTLRIQENGIMCSDFLGEDVAAPVKETGDTINILSISRLLPRKNIAAVVLALNEAIVHLGFEQIRLCIAGPDCGERQSLERLVQKLGLGAHVRFAGPVPYENIKSLLEKNDIFILSSLYEGLPLALLEAMVCGKAVIFSNSEIGRKVISDGVDGLLVDPQDALGIAKAIVRLAQDNEYRLALGRCAKKKARQFDSSVEKMEIEKFYRKAVDDHKKTSY